MTNGKIVELEEIDQKSKEIAGLRKEVEGIKLILLTEALKLTREGLEIVIEKNGVSGEISDPNVVRVQRNGEYVDTKNLIALVRERVPDLCEKYNQKKAQYELSLKEIGEMVNEWETKYLKPHSS